jgi:hypothetical protein
VGGELRALNSYIVLCYNIPRRPSKEGMYSINWRRYSRVYKSYPKRKLDIFKISHKRVLGFT